MAGDVRIGYIVFANLVLRLVTISLIPLPLRDP